jgi:hypothetical protein
MTKSGSLAYYMAAVVCGSFFFTLAQFVIGRQAASSSNWARDFLLAFFLDTIFGCVSQLIAAFVLRRLARPLRWSNAWHWAVGGAGVYLLVLITLGLIGAGYDRVAAGPRWTSLGLFLFGQAATSLHGGIRQALVAGALTSVVLFSVHRAFSQQRTEQEKRV